MLDEKTIRSRVLSASMESVIASIYFSPEAHDAFHALGFGPTGGRVSGEWAEKHWGTALMPDYTAYISARGAHLGTPPGEVVAATFGIFQPAMVISMINEGRKIATSEQLREARDSGAIAQLERILGEKPEGIDLAVEALERAARDLPLCGRPMFAGLMAYPVPESRVGAMWRHGERLREFRGDAFVAAWSTRGLTGIQIQLLTEVLAGFPRFSYTGARGWSEEEMNQAEADLTEMGYLADGKATEEGRRIREEIEQVTDRACAPMIDAIGDDFIELVTLLKTWSEQVIEAEGHAPATPQEQVMDPAVQEWMESHGLQRFAFGPAA